MHDPQDRALQRAEEIYQRLMRELRSDMERLRRSASDQAPTEPAERGQQGGGREPAMFWAHR